MKKLFSYALLVAALFAPGADFATPSCPAPLDGNCSVAPAGGFSFGAAKSHPHSRLVSDIGFYCGHGLVSDPTNNPGNAFFGNTVCVVSTSDFAPHWYWFDWSEDRDASAGKLARWHSSYPIRLVKVTYDPDCMTAVLADDPPTIPALTSRPGRGGDEPARLKLSRRAAVLRPRAPTPRPSPSAPPARHPAP